MSSPVSGTVGINFRVNGTKVNDALIPVGGPFTFDGLPSGTGFSITATAVDAAGNESAPSVVVPASTLQQTHSGGPLSDMDKAAVDAIVSASMAESGQPGVIVSITGPRGYYSKAYGSTGTRTITTDDHFRIGSTTKMFTTTAFWMAVDQGLVSLDDTLEQYVPGVPQGASITMRHLLSMRSGVFDYQSDTTVALTFSIFPTYTFSEAGALQIIKANASRFTPGTQYAYTNSNFVLLGAVVEAVTGRLIKDVITEDIITPLGLTETQWPSSATIPTPAASAGAINPELFGAAGALTSTVGDLVKWAQAVRDGTLISYESWDTWTGTFIGYASGMSQPTTFGYGLGMESLGTWLGHNGSVPGFGTSCTFDTVSGATIAVSENKQTSTPVVLAAYTRIFHDIALYLYPSSMDEQDYLGAKIRPRAAALTVTGATPLVTVTPGDRHITPTGAVLYIIGGTGSNDVVPTPAALTVTGSTPTVTVVPAVLVSYSAVGAGSPTGYPFDITVARGDTVVLYLVADRGYNPTATCGGVAMTMLAQVRMPAYSGNGVMCQFALKPATSGTKTISFTSSNWTSAQAVAYANVNGFEIPKVITGTGTPSQAVTVGAGNIVSQAFAVGTNPAFASPTGGTNRWLSNSNASMIVNDTGSSATFAAGKTGSNVWVGMSTELRISTPTVPYFVDLSRFPATTAGGTNTFSGPSALVGDYVVVDIEVTDTASTISSVTYDGASMTQLGSTLTYTGTGGGRLLRFGISVAAAGVKTVSFAKTGFGWNTAEAVVIRNVTSDVATTTATNNNSSPSHAVTLASSELVLQTFGTGGPLGQIRGGANINDTGAGTNFTALGTSISDASTTFTASATAIAWGSIATRFN